MNFIRLKWMISIIFLTILCNACKNNDSNEAQEIPSNVNENRLELTTPQLRNANLSFCTLRNEQIPTRLILHGKIDVPPQNMVSVSVPLGGYLRSTSLLPGMHVRKGQVIATMEDQQYVQMQEDYLSAVNTLGLYRKEFQRQKELNQSKAVSDKVYQQAESNFRGQEIVVNALREKLKLINVQTNSLTPGSISRTILVYSPIDGFVSNVKVNVGKYVNPSEVLFELVNPSDIHLNLTVFEKDIEKLNIGQQVWAYTNNDSTKKYLCEVILLGKDISMDRSVEVHCHFVDYDKSLLPGMYMNAEVELQSSIANAVPEEAVVRFESRHYVFVQKSEKVFEMKEVKIGRTFSGQIEVSSPEISFSDNIVAKGSYTLLMSLKNKSEE